MSFFQELSRRNVVKVAGIYIVAAWLILQVTDVLSDMLPVPDWTGSFVFLLLLIGLPIVVIFSWLYELTPEGLRRETSPADSDAPRKASRLDTLITVLLVAVLVALVADRIAPPDDTPATAAGLTGGADQETVAPPREDDVSAESVKSIAVLPFANMSKDPSEDYFSDGVSAQILNALSGVKGMEVTSRTTVDAIQGQNKSIQEIAETLGIRYVIDGSVFRAGDRIRITAQLVDAERDVNIWSETYDETASDLFRIQDDISRSIISNLQLEVFGDGVSSSVPASIDTYDLYLRAKENFTTPGKVQETQDQLDRVLEQDPNFVAALALRARVALGRSDVFFGTREFPKAEVLPLADRLLTRAESIDKASPEVLIARGLFYETRAVGSDDPAGNLEQAMQAYDAALEQRPNSTRTRQFKARVLGVLGKSSEAVDQLRIAWKYDKVNNGVNGDLFNWSVMANDLEFALETLDRWKAIEPDSLHQKYHRARYQRFVGELADSFRLLKELEEIPGLSPSQRRALVAPRGEVLLALGLYDEAMALSEDNPRYKIRALTLSGRHGEAILLAKRWASEQPGNLWPTDELLRALYYGNRWDEFSDLYQQDPNLEPALRDYQYYPMSTMAYAALVGSGREPTEFLQTYLAMSNESPPNFDEAKVEALMITARKLAANGQEDEAAELIDQAVDRFLYAPRILLDPELARLALREDVSRSFDKMEERINEQRRMLDLPPISLIRRSST